MTTIAFITTVIFAFVAGIYFGLVFAAKAIASGKVDNVKVIK